LENILKVIGISAIVSTIVTFVFDTIRYKINLRFENLFMEKMKRYNSLLVFMSVIIDVKNYEHIETSYKPKVNEEQEIKDYYMREIKLHNKFCVLFASEKVVLSIDNFIDNPTQENYNTTARAMRYDLWHRKFKR